MLHLCMQTIDIVFRHVFLPITLVVEPKHYVHACVEIDNRSAVHLQLSRLRRSLFALYSAAAVVAMTPLLL